MSDYETGYEDGYNAADDAAANEIYRLKRRIEELEAMLDERNMYKSVNDIERDNQITELETELQRLRRVEQAAVAYVKSRYMDKPIMEQIGCYDELKAALEGDD